MRSTSSGSLPSLSTLESGSFTIAEKSWKGSVSAASRVLSRAATSTARTFVEFWSKEPSENVASPNFRGTVENLTELGCCAPKVTDSVSLDDMSNNPFDTHMQSLPAKQMDTTLFCITVRH
jgi:hypothetical protein